MTEINDIIDGLEKCVIIEQKILYYYVSVSNNDILNLIYNTLFKDSENNELDIYITARTILNDTNNDLKVC
jgi:hypothetical protein